VFGELGGGTSPRTERLHDMLQRAGIAVELHHAVQVVLWQKFLFICAFSGVTAVSRLPIGTILANRVTHDLFRGASEEVEAVARAHGIALPADCVEQAMATAAAVEPWGRGSLYHDLAGGRRLELESLNGEVARRGPPTPARLSPPCCSAIRSWLSASRCKRSPLEPSRPALRPGRVGVSGSAPARRHA
jgi:2-dehydropantoate 2-reductase